MISDLTHINESPSVYNKKSISWRNPISDCLSTKSIYNHDLSIIMYFSRVYLQFQWIPSVIEEASFYEKFEESPQRSQPVPETDVGQGHAPWARPLPSSASWQLENERWYHLVLSDGGHDVSVCRRRSICPRNIYLNEICNVLIIL